MRDTLIKITALTLAGLTAAAGMRGVKFDFDAGMAALVAGGSLFMAFGNALMLLTGKGALVPFYHGGELDSREDYMKRPHGKFQNVTIPLTFGLFFLVAVDF